MALFGAIVSYLAHYQNDVLDKVVLGILSIRRVQLIHRLKKKIPLLEDKNSDSNGKMFSIEDFIITVFCNVDDLWLEITQNQRIRRRLDVEALLRASATAK